MNNTKKRWQFFQGTVGVAVVAALACIPCCLPLIAGAVAAISGWLGVAILATTEQAGLAAAATALAIGITWLVWRRRRARTCACRSSCRSDRCSAG